MGPSIPGDVPKTRPTASNRVRAAGRERYVAFTRAADHGAISALCCARKPLLTIQSQTEDESRIVERKVTLAEFKKSMKPYSTSAERDPDRLMTTSATTHTRPDLLRAKLDYRAGVDKDEYLAPGYSRHSRGLLPGKTAGARFEGLTTYRADHRRLGPVRREQPSLTLTWVNAIGSADAQVQVPPSELMNTHFTLGKEPLDYSTSTSTVHVPQERGTGQEALPAFGEIAQEGPRGTEYNIVHGGEPMKPSRYYDPSMPMGLRSSWREERLAPGTRVNTITGALQNW